MKALTALAVGFLFGLSMVSCNNSPPTNATLIQADPVSISNLPIILSATEDGSLPSVSFIYPHKIYAFVTFPNSLQGKRDLEAHWIRPDGGTQENAFFKHDFSADSARRMFFWFQFHESSLHEIGTSVRKSHESAVDFNGKWILRIFCDGTNVASSAFTVSGAPAVDK
jgi:hypothetical protein